MSTSTHVYAHLRMSMHLNDLMVPDILQGLRLIVLDIVQSSQTVLDIDPVISLRTLVEYLVFSNQSTSCSIILVSRSIFRLPRSNFIRSSLPSGLARGSLPVLSAYDTAKYQIGIIGSNASPTVPAAL